MAKLWFDVDELTWQQWQAYKKRHAQTNLEVFREALAVLLREEQLRDKRLERRKKEGR